MILLPTHFPSSRVPHTAEDTTTLLLAGTAGLESRCLLVYLKPSSCLTPFMCASKNIKDISIFQFLAGHVFGATGAAKEISKRTDQTVATNNYIHVWKMSGTCVTDSRLQTKGTLSTGLDVPVDGTVQCPLFPCHTYSKSKAMSHNLYGTLPPLTNGIIWGVCVCVCV